MAKAAEMHVDELLKSDMPGRIAHAANYQFGRICEVTISAIQEAALSGGANAAASGARQKLTRRHFVDAYLEHSDSRARDSVNPFISPDWARLRPGYFILKPKPPEEAEYDDYYGD